MKLAEDRWLAERFGHPVFTVEPPDTEPEALRDHALEVGTASYQARLPAEQSGLKAELEEAGFATVNETITMRRQASRLEGADPGVEIRAGELEAHGEIVEIAERSFTGSRFHLDPDIPDEVASRIKRDWAQNALEGGRGDGVLVALRDGSPVGFLATLLADEDGRRVRVIDLIAVDGPARGSGVGEALVARFAQESSGYDELRVGTQAANKGATRFYERLGFTAASSAFDLHLHVGDPWAR